MEKYYAIIIGFGKGGKILAARLSAKGLKVALIEKSSGMYGGTCINIGCIPTKTLIHSAKEASLLFDKDKAHLLGRGMIHKKNENKDDFEKRAAFYAEAIENKENVISFLRTKNLHNIIDKDNITLYNGTASFVGPQRVKVVFGEHSQNSGNSNMICSSHVEDKLSDGVGETILEGEYVIVDTGSESVIPSFKGVGLEGVYTSTTLLNRKKLPKKLVIIGGGYIGLEFANMYASFGSKVTVLERGGEFIPREDRDIAQMIRENLEQKDIRIEMNAGVSAIELRTEVEKGTENVLENMHQMCDPGVPLMVKYTQRELLGAQDKAKSQTLQNQERLDNRVIERIIEADAVLLAMGRKPATDGLNLNLAGIEIDERGAIKVDGHLRSTNPHVFAIGDVKGGAQFTYISQDDSRIVVEQLFGNKDSGREITDREPVVYSVFIDPPLSRIGISEEEAYKRGLDVTVKKIAASAVPRTRTLGQTQGILKSVVSNQTGEVLGCTLFCAESGEMINSVSLAMKFHIPASGLRDFIYTHPSMSEAFNDLF